MAEISIFEHLKSQANVIIFHLLTWRTMCNTFVLVKVMKVFVLFIFETDFSLIGDENVTTFVVTFLEVLIYLCREKYFICVYVNLR